jgi:uncharacterized protein YbjQ (UPF0145 family)
MMTQRMAGKATGPELRAASELGQRTGTAMTPGTMTLDPDALAFESLLRQSPGNRRFWADFDQRSIINASKFADQAITRAAGPSVGAESAGKIIGGAIDSYDRALVAARREATSKLFDGAAQAAGNVKLTTSNTSAAIEALAKEGLDVTPLRTRLGNTGLEIPEMNRALQDFGKMARGKPPVLFSDRSTAQYAASKVKRALEADLEAATKDPALGAAADMLRQARDAYREMSKPINDLGTSTVRRMLKLGKDTKAEEIPRVLLRSSGEQIRKVMAVLEEVDPAKAMVAKRAMIDEALGVARAGGKNALPEGASLMEKRMARSQFNESTPAMVPSKVRNAIRTNFDSLAAALGGDKKAMADLRDIVDVFDRIDISMGFLTGSPTATHIMNQEFTKALFNIIQHPIASSREIGLMVTKSKLSKIITDPTARDLFLKLSKVPPGVKTRVASRLSSQLTAILNRDDGEEEETQQAPPADTTMRYMRNE